MKAHICPALPMQMGKAGAGFVNRQRELNSFVTVGIMRFGIVTIVLRLRRDSDIFQPLFAFAKKYAFGFL
jgi:hypothetical protein